ncbi:MAG: DUF2007 domain-containing protein [Planctomycetes bacterium]|nr:DUF2007 domain-containing protein [Planctomycetota bacterium]
MRCVLTCGNLAQAEAIQATLTAVGISAQVVAEDNGSDCVVLEIFVPAGDEEQAREIISRGGWPRLA